MIRAVFDTNVIISGVTAQSGSPHELLQAWRRGKVIVLTSEAITNEVVEVLQRPFFQEKRHLNEEDVAGIRHLLMTDAVVVFPENCLDVVHDDPDDNRILECAVGGNADYIVSGDHHLLAVKWYRGIRIVTVRDFLTILKFDLSSPAR